MSTPQYHSPYDQARKKRHLISVMVIGVSVSLFLAVAGVFGWNFFTAPKLDERLCIQDEAPVEIWSVLIDVSDVYNQIQVESIRNRVREIKKEIPKHALIALFSIRPDPNELLRPIIHLCNPGDGSELSKLTANPEMARKMWEEQFEQPFESALEEIVTSDGQLSQSPIMEGIRAQKVALEGYGETKLKRLFVISDMMQHSEVWSQYGSGALDFDRFKRERTFDRVRTDLSDWKVEINYVRRTELDQQGRSHIDFWDQYFFEQGASVERVTRIDG